MKRLVSILTVVFLFGTSTYAQRGKEGHMRETLSVEQQTTLAVKKMTLKLDLTKAQQRKVKPLIAAQISDKKAMKEKRKVAKERKKRPTADERYEMENARLDKQIAFKKAMKEILSDEQFAKFEKMKKFRKGKKMKKMKKKMKKHKEQKEEN